MNNEKIFGFYNYGKEWLDGYKIIKRESPGETPHISLKYFLLSRAIEIFLKTFLLAKGIEFEELKKKKYGHNIGNLYSEASDLGLKGICKIEKQDEEIIGILNQYYSKKEFEYLNDSWHHLPVIRDVEKFTHKLDKSMLELGLKLLRSKVNRSSKTEL
jgi:hypothetical protein